MTLSFNKQPRHQAHDCLFALFALYCTVIQCMLIIISVMMEATYLPLDLVPVRLAEFRRNFGTFTGIPGIRRNGRIPSVR